MPETGIGLIPDVGGTWLLADAPGETGVYLGLTGEPMGAADAIYARFADVFIPSAKIAQLVERLVDAKGGTVGGVIAPAPGDAGLRSWPSGAPTSTAPSAATRRGHAGGAGGIRRASGPRRPPPADAEIAEVAKAHAGRHSQRADPGSLEEALNVEFRLCVRLFEDGEFIEGVRALLVDKDRKPKWSPARLGSRAETVAAYLAPLPPARSWD